MLGWEYPPHINGGLGTACQGLTTALAGKGIKINFVMPRLFGDEIAPHMQLLGSTDVTQFVDSPLIEKFTVPAFLSPYLNVDSYQYYLRRAGGICGFGDTSAYNWDLFGEVESYAARILAMAGGWEFDLIHAHDWMTFPAAVSLAEATGKPLIVHLHSLEYDRSGAAVNQRICEIERFGILAADRVVAVSHYTQALLCHHYGIEREKIGVVHNGVYSREVVQGYRRAKQWGKRVVLFLGRITFQKGPDYFVEAAAKVVPHLAGVTFVMAGAGDMLSSMMDRVHQLGLDSHFHFPGFLRGEEVEEMLSVADLYVMPSVSEPFGISALEAMSSDTPVIISRQSGVSEVLHHALKVDFWDVDRMADLIINVLLHDELKSDMVSMARDEVRRLHWEAAALKTIDIYHSLV